MKRHTNNRIQILLRLNRPCRTIALLSGINFEGRLKTRKTDIFSISSFIRTRNQQYLSCCHLLPPLRLARGRVGVGVMFRRNIKIC